MTRTATLNIHVGCTAGQQIPTGNCIITDSNMRLIGTCSLKAQWLQDAFPDQLRGRLPTLLSRDASHDSVESLIEHQLNTRRLQPAHLLRLPSRDGIEPIPDRQLGQPLLRQDLALLKFRDRFDVVQRWMLEGCAAEAVSAWRGVGGGLGSVQESERGLQLDNPPSCIQLSVIERRGRFHRSYVPRNASRSLKPLRP